MQKKMRLPHTSRGVDASSLRRLVGMTMCLQNFDHSQSLSKCRHGSKLLINKNTTPLKINMSSQKLPSQKESRLPTIIFQAGEPSLFNFQELNIGSEFHDQSNLLHNFGSQSFRTIRVWCPNHEQTTVKQGSRTGLVKPCHGVKAFPCSK